jgi:hypothetical protein
MSRFRSNPVDLVIFLAGCAAVGWIAVGYIGSNSLALAVALLIGACYLAGALELRRYGRASATLDEAVASLSAAPASLDAWLDRIDPALRGPVRLRVTGERAALPGPALTPYLVGLLVLLGMLGTLLGMVATLNGTGAALQNASDLVAMRASLAAPVRGLGFAFGTSIAGVATSAMLGLLSALARRRRGESAARLDTKIATTLRIFSHAHQREANFKLMQRQAEAMPVLVDRLQSMMQAIEQQSVALNERQIALQQHFFDKAEAAYAGLAESVARTLKESAAEGARAAGAAIRPVVETTMAGIKTDTAALHDAVTQAVEHQLAGLSGGFETTMASFKTETATLHDTVTQAVERQLAGLSGGFETTMAGIKTETAALHDAVTQAVERQLAGLSGGFETTTAAVSTLWREALADHRRTNEALAADLRASLDRYADAFEQRSAGLIDNVTARLDTAAGTVSERWNAALAQHTEASERLAAGHEQALSAVTSTFEQHAGALLRAVNESHAKLQTDLASGDEARLAAWRESVAAMSAALREHWDGAATQTADRQQAICDTLERTANAITTQTQAQARDTIAEIARLVQAASEAPRAAADVIAELRQKLSESMVRDTAMLEERSRLLATLETLLEAVNHASTQQRGAIDALVSTSADLLERVGTRFTDRVESETDRLDGIAAQVTQGAVEVASLGDAFGASVAAFGESNDKLIAHLQRIESALDKSLARSDEQLAYYVAQAREVIDLSMMSQRQIMEDLQRLAERRDDMGTQAGAETA